ncbi:MAG: WYL domain-containing protein [Bacteroidetes bacterium]|nr:WYL domain-containing protein [Bacteroidota bacterium]
MSLNKYALIRYRVINQCLKDYKYVTKDKLKKACEGKLDITPISYRTIDADIHNMRHDDRLGYNAPIKFDAIRKVYYYDDPDYSIDQFPLNREEVLALSFTATLLQQFKHVDIFNKFAGSVQKIVDAVKVYRLSEENETLSFVDFEKVPSEKGSEHLHVLINAIRHKKVVHIVYRAFYSGKNHQHDIHPYLLKQYRNRWYLIGFMTILEKSEYMGWTGLWK